MVRDAPTRTHRLDFRRWIDKASVYAQKPNDPSSARSVCSLAKRRSHFDRD